jgi:hypothetical protein
MKFCLESIFSVFIDSGLLIFLFYEQFCLIRDQYQSISISVLMLYYSFFYEMYHRPYILEFYIIDSCFFSLLLSPFQLSTYFTFIVSQLPINLVFLAKTDFSCYNDMTYISYLDWFFISR